MEKDLDNDFNNGIYPDDCDDDFTSSNNTSAKRHKSNESDLADSDFESEAHLSKFQSEKSKVETGDSILNGSEEKCPNCGRPLSRGERFCPQCGTECGLEDDCDDDLISLNYTSSESSTSHEFPWDESDFINDQHSEKDQSIHPNEETGDSNLHSGMKQCPNCRRYLNFDDNYCCYCGAQLDNESDITVVNKKESVVCSREEYENQEHVDKREYENQEHVDKREYENQKHVDKREYENQKHVDKQEYESQKHVDRQKYLNQKHVDKQEYESQEHVDKQEYDSQIHVNTLKRPWLKLVYDKITKLKSDQKRFRKFKITIWSVLALCCASLLVVRFLPEPPDPPLTRVVTTTEELPSMDGLYGFTQYVHDKKVDKVRTAAVRKNGNHYEIGIVTDYRPENHTFTIGNNGELNSPTLGKGQIVIILRDNKIKIVFESRENKWVLKK